jgi:hypothetical protein
VNARQVRRQIATAKPWVQRVLDLLDLFDWKTWVWYSLLGIEKIVTGLIVRAKRRGFQPGEMRVKRGKFYVVPKR